MKQYKECSICSNVSALEIHQMIQTRLSKVATVLQSTKHMHGYHMIKHHSVVKVQPSILCCFFAARNSSTWNISNANNFPEKVKYCSHFRHSNVMYIAVEHFWHPCGSLSNILSTQIESFPAHIHFHLVPVQCRVTPKYLKFVVTNHDVFWPMYVAPMPYVSVAVN